MWTFLIRWTIHPHKSSQNCCHQTFFLGSKYMENAFAAEALLQILMEELITFPQTP